MNDTSASLTRKIHSAGDLQSVVRTMKAMAASSIGQYEQSVRALSDYYRTVELGLGVCLRKSKERVDSSLISNAKSPLKTERTKGEVGAVVFGSDQGLVGQFNEKVTDFAIASLATLSVQPHLWAVGERVHERLVDAGFTVLGLFPVPNSVKSITPLVGKILVAHEALLGSNIDDPSELHLFYNQSATDTRTPYAPVAVRLLPLDNQWLNRLLLLPWNQKSLPEIVGDDPIGVSTLLALIREYLFVSLFRACAESLVSENASRLSAMDRADRNILDLLENMKGRFHELRQSGIDAELFDVISGFEALQR